LVDWKIILIARLEVVSVSRILNVYSNTEQVSMQGTGKVKKSNQQ